MKELMIKPNMGVVNFNIDRKLPSKQVKYLGSDGVEDIIIYGRIVDIEKRFPNGEDKNIKIQAEAGTPDPSADIPIFDTNLIPVSLAGALNNATNDLKAASDVMLNSVQGMVSGLDSLAKGNADEIIALAELDAVILEAKVFLGDIGQGQMDEIKPGIDNSILKASAVTDKASLGKLKGITGPDGIKVPDEVRRLDGSNMVNFNVDKTGNFRDVLTEVDVRVGDGDDAVFEKQNKTVRVYGSETDLTTRFGARDPVEEAKAKYTKPKPTNIKTPTISTAVYKPDNPTAGGFSALPRLVTYDKVRGRYNVLNPATNVRKQFKTVAEATAYAKSLGIRT